MKVPPSNEVVPWNLPALDRRPVIIAVAGPNGAGKSTFYEAHLRLMFPPDRPIIPMRVSFANCFR